jgi:hypothetical protein
LSGSSPKQCWLSRCFLGIAKVTEPNSNEAKPLLGIQACTVALRRCDAGQFLEGRGRSGERTANWLVLRICFDVNDWLYKEHW